MSTPDTSSLDDQGREPSGGEALASPARGSFRTQFAVVGRDDGDAQRHVHGDVAVPLPREARALGSRLLGPLHHHAVLVRVAVVLVLDDVVALVLLDGAVAVGRRDAVAAREVHVRHEDLGGLRRALGRVLEHEGGGGGRELGAHHGAADLARVRTRGGRVLEVQHDLLARLGREHVRLGGRGHRLAAAGVRVHERLLDGRLRVGRLHGGRGHGRGGGGGGRRKRLGLGGGFSEVLASSGPQVELVRTVGSWFCDGFNLHIARSSVLDARLATTAWHCAWASDGSVIVAERLVAAATAYAPDRIRSKVSTELSALTLCSLALVRGG
ncbi:hypothetical protein ON010_g11000 [Phytophthora cinnamomi]|nr:hypothetical protein ON010_g11000 [Phytophthora cinnamomi]